MEKFVRCEKCGAMVKVLIDCTCGDCGINVVMRQWKKFQKKKQKNI